MAYAVIAYIVMAYIVMAYAVIAYILMAYIVVAYAVIAYVVTVAVSGGDRAEHCAPVHQCSDSRSQDQAIFGRVEVWKIGGRCLGIEPIRVFGIEPIAACNVLVGARVGGEQHLLDEADQPADVVGVAHVRFWLHKHTDGPHDTPHCPIPTVVTRPRRRIHSKFLVVTRLASNTSRW